ncbi:hypothetical protein EYC84_000069 [Monilinia fructicola]|uniref:Uncharacterized protein n=1 Tax=Monilinia fructicola TaxID=38448 RepID=A0A5M9JN30_MONFR|nr:hypothetical protein EYC84_000069 [Monilinia fructicola]
MQPNEMLLTDGTSPHDDGTSTYDHFDPESDCDLSPLSAADFSPSWRAPQNADSRPAVAVPDAAACRAVAVAHMHAFQTRPHAWQTAVESEAAAIACAW